MEDDEAIFVKPSIQVLNLAKTAVEDGYWQAKSREARFSKIKHPGARFCKNRGRGCHWRMVRLIFAKLSIQVLDLAKMVAEGD